jgi:hypothetical protein
MAKAFVLLTAATIMALTGCSSKVRTVHLTPDAQAADVYVDGKLMQTDLAYKNISCYKDAAAGCRDFKLMPAGEECPTFVDCRVKLDCNRHVTVAAMGASSQDMRCVMYCDDLRVDPCNAKVRIIHASPDAPSVDVAFARITRDGDVAEPCPPGEPQIKNLCFQDASCYEYLEPGNYEFQAMVSRTNTTALQIPEMTLCPGTNYTIFIIGQTRDNSLYAMSVVDAQSEAR